MNMIGAAKAAYSLCISNVPGADGVPCLNNLCNLQLLTSRLIADFQPCETAVRLSPEDPIALRNMGNLLVQMVEYTKAIPFLEKSHVKAPTDKQTFHNLCLAYSRAGKCKKALGCSEALIEYDNTDSGAYSGLAIAANCCNRTDSRGVIPRLRSSELKAEQAHGTGCKSFTFKTDWGTSEYKKTIINKGGEKYGVEKVTALPLGSCDNDKGYIPPRVIFEEKQVAIIELHDVFMQASSGIIFQGSPDCNVFSGDHLFATKVQEEFNGGGNDDLKADIIYEHPIASVVQQNPGNYYHAIAETASRIAVFKSHLLNEKSIPLLVPKSKSSLVSQALDMFFPKIEGQQQTQEIIDYTGEKKLFFKTLFVVDWRNEHLSPDQITDSWLPFFPPRYVMKLMIKELQRFVFQSDTLPMPSTWKVIYMSRGDAGVRRVLPNEDQIITGIKSLVGGAEHFLLVNGKGMTLEDQIRTFSNASLIIGPHGAGLTNMLWAPSGSSVIIYPMRPVSDVCFAHMAFALGHKYYEVGSLHSYYYGDYHLSNKTVLDVIEAVNQALVLQGIWKPPKDNENDCSTDGSCNS